MRQRVYFSAIHENKVLLLEVHDSVSKTNKFKFFSGKIQTGESHFQAVSREVQEELGYSGELEFSFEMQVNREGEHFERAYVYQINAGLDLVSQKRIMEGEHFIGHLIWQDLNDVTKDHFLWPDQFNVITQLRTQLLNLT